MSYDFCAQCSLAPKPAPQSAPEVDDMHGPDFRELYEKMKRERDDAQMQLAAFRFENVEFMESLLAKLRAVKS